MRWRFRGLRAPVLLALALLLCPCRGAQERPPEEVQLDLIDPTLDAQGIEAPKGGIVRGPGFHFEAGRMQIRRDPSSRRARALHASGGVYIHYHGNRFIGSKLEFDLANKTGVLRRGRTQLGRWYVGGEEVYLQRDGTYRLSAPIATLSPRLPSRWRLAAEELKLNRDRTVEVQKLNLRIGQQPVAKFGTFGCDVRKLRRWPLIIRVSGGGKNQRRLGLRYILRGQHSKTNLEIDRWWTRGWGLGAHTRGHAGNQRWTLAHYSLRELKPRRERYTSSASYRQSWKAHNALFEAKLYRASDRNFSKDRFSESTIYRTIPISVLRYRQFGDRWFFTAKTVLKLNSYETVKRTLPQLTLRARPRKLLGDWTFDQTAQLAHLKLSFPKKSSESDFGAWRGLWTGSVYRSWRLGGGLTATGMVSARAYAVSASPAGDAVSWITPRWDGQLQTSFYDRWRRCSHRWTPFIHHAICPSRDRQMRRCYVFDLEEAPTGVQKIEWGVRGALSGPARPWFDYELALRDPIGPLSRRGAHLAIGELLWHANSRLDLGMSLQAERRHWRLDRVRLFAKTTFSRTLAATVEYDRRGRYSWRGIGSDRDWLQQLHPIEELLGSKLSDRRQYLTGQLYWRLEPNFVFRVFSRWGFGRDRGQGKPQRGPFWEFGICGATMLSDTWKVQLGYRQRRGTGSITFDFSATPKVLTVTQRYF